MEKNFDHYSKWVGKFYFSLKSVSYVFVDKKPYIMPPMEIFKDLVAQSLGIEISPLQLTAFRAYESLLLEWNEKFNLTSITDPEEIHVKHFLDSLTALNAIQPEAAFSLIDIGTGAGFPGIPLKIMRPEISLTLVESSQKKAEFCQAVTRKLSLLDTTVVAARAEDLGKDPAYRSKFDWAIARAVADLSILAEYMLPFVKIGGKALAMKGANTDDEIRKAGRALRILGGEIVETRNFNYQMILGIER